MKLVKQTKLFFKENNSDKVYEIDLCQLSDTEYLVNFRYGRRGANLKEGTKTPTVVLLEKAESLYSALEKEKRSKGYQSESEVFVELPTIKIGKPTSAEDAILLRLQDAVEKTNSFKTEWKTSRVIWKAAELNIQQAVPFILKLTTRGDEMQLYASLHALLRFEAEEAEDLFKSYSLSSKQKMYIRNIATEGWINLCLKKGDTTEIEQMLVEKLPFDVKYDIEQNDFQGLEKDLLAHSKNNNVKYFSDLYLLAKIRTELLPSIQNTITRWELRPPYFRYIRSIYKLAQVRQDYATLAPLTYGFEHRQHMFVTPEIHYEGQKNYVEVIADYISVEKELKKEDSRLAYSKGTRQYLQRNSIQALKSAGATGNVSNYLRLALSTLLQYTEQDYQAAENLPVSQYGAYNSSDSRCRYHYTIKEYPECRDSPLLLTILFGNNKGMTLQKNLKYIIGEYKVKSENYYYNINNVVRLDAVIEGNKSSHSNEKESSLLGFVKNIFGKKELEISTPIQQNIPQVEEYLNQDYKLYPELWDQMPQAYIQLLVQARMEFIHKFAYENLKQQKDFDQLIAKLDINTVFRLALSEFNTPTQFAYDLIIQKESEFLAQPLLVIQLLQSSNTDILEWAKKQIEIKSLANDFDCIVELILNQNPKVKGWINDLLNKTILSEERTQAILGKVIVDMLQWKDLEDVNQHTILISQRISMLAKRYYKNISWDIVTQLLESPIKDNVLLASEITLEKVDRDTIQMIPFSLIQLFLINEIESVRENGIKLLSYYPSQYFKENSTVLFQIIEEAKYKKVVVATLNTMNSLIMSNNRDENNKLTLQFVFPLVCKEAFEGAHEIIIEFAKDKLKSSFIIGLTPKYLFKLLFSNYRNSQIFGYDILTERDINVATNKFSMGQIVALASHELLNVRQWVWSYYKAHIEEIKEKKNISLNILDSKWDDSREFAFHYFRTEFIEQDWDPETLISIADSIRVDVESFGRELITKYFNNSNGLEYLTKLSQHPSMNIQALVTNYLNQYAEGNATVIGSLDHYFRSVLTRVNKARVAKNRVFKFLEKEALSSVDIATVVLPIIDDISAQSTVQDKSTCIHILAQVKAMYPDLGMHLSIKTSQHAI